MKKAQWPRLDSPEPIIKECYKKQTSFTEMQEACKKAGFDLSMEEIYRLVDKMECEKDLELYDHSKIRLSMLGLPEDV